MVRPEEQAIIDSFQRTAPVDITALADGLGVAVYDVYDLPPGVSGMIARDLKQESKSGFLISVNGNEPYRRRRFTVAHECAHYLLHRDKIGDGITDDALYRSDRMNSQEEFDANNLAATLLMPKRLVLAQVRKGIDDIKQLAEAFQVSTPAMEVRMRYLYRFDYK